MREPTIRELMDGLLNPTVPMEWKYDIARALAERLSNRGRV